MVASVVLLSALVQDQGPPYFNKLVPNPTGQNGYEEYIRAVDHTETASFKNAFRRLRGEGTQATYLKGIDKQHRFSDGTDLEKRQGRQREGGVFSSGA